MFSESVPIFFFFFNFFLCKERNLREKKGKPEETKKRKKKEKIRRKERKKIKNHNTHIFSFANDPTLHSHSVSKSKNFDNPALAPAPSHPSWFFFVLSFFEQTFKGRQRSNEQRENDVRSNLSASNYQNTILPPLLLLNQSNPSYTFKRLSKFSANHPIIQPPYMLLCRTTITIPRLELRFFFFEESENERLFFFFFFVLFCLWGPKKRSRPRPWFGGGRPLDGPS